MRLERITLKGRIHERLTWRLGEEGISSIELLAEPVPHVRIVQDHRAMGKPLHQVVGWDEWASPEPALKEAEPDGLHRHIQQFAEAVYKGMQGHGCVTRVELSPTAWEQFSKEVCRKAGYEKHHQVETGVGVCVLVTKEPK